MEKQQITLRLESHRPSSTKSSAEAAGRLAREMNLNITARGHYKKKNQLKITLISGPHVHKKSRDQYKIDRFGAYLVLGGVGGAVAASRQTPLTYAGFFETPQTPQDPKLGRGTSAMRSTKSGGEREKFLEFKNKLYRQNLDQGFSLTFTYLDRETLVIQRRWGGFFQRRGPLVWKRPRGNRKTCLQETNELIIKNK